MSDFAQRMDAFAEKVARTARAIHVGTVGAILGSVTAGSPVTGAPGQPVASGDLIGSWDQRIEGDEGHVFTNHPAAKVIEGGTRRGRALVLRSGRGGFHSVALTIAGADRLVEQVAREVVGA